MRHLLLLLVGLGALHSVQAEPPAPLPGRKILFLGDNGHHRPYDRYRQLVNVLAPRGIQLTYTDSVASLNPDTLGKYDGLVVYANHTQWSPEQEKALLDFVEKGKGFVPLHCASACWNSSEKYVALVGAKFASHKTGVFPVEAVAKHPILAGCDSFTSWDETYVHADHNPKDRTVLEERVEQGRREPWTWVRTQGKGRVFYTAWGHDERTWSHPGFHSLVERGIRWSLGDDPTKCVPYLDKPKLSGPSPDAAKPELVDAKVPFYPAGGKGGPNGGPITKMPLPLSVEKSLPHLQLPADLEAVPFVTEPQLGGKPMTMAWDERGRLWVCVTVDYPNELRAQGKGNDRIVICEDTKGTGRADKLTVFADKLSIPTSLCFARGGLIVHAAPHTLFLKDTNGDDVSDVRETLFSGWGTRDTHAGPSNLRYGLDGWIYGIVGYSGFNGRVGGVDHRFGQGIYRFKPDGSSLEFLRSTSNNSWGLGFSEEGYLFGSTANGCASVYLAIPNRYYEGVRGWSATVLPNISLENRFYPITDRVRQVDWHGGFTSAAGHALYTARTYDRTYWNRTAFVSDPTGHLSATFVLQPNGTDFVARYGWNLLASTDEWTAPIVAEVGPDGHVWLIDWYAYIVQHNPTPQGFTTGAGNAYETPLRDRKHGRIYRLVKKDAPAGKVPELKTPEQMVTALGHDNMLWRLHAQRLLVERGNPDVQKALVDLAGRQGVDGIGLAPGAMHALWTLHGLGRIEKDEAVRKAVLDAMTHPSAGVRRTAALVLPRDPAGAFRLGTHLDDANEDPQVLLARLLALAEMPVQSDLGATLKALAMNRDLLADRHLPDALTAAAARHDFGFLQAIAAETKPLDPRTLQIVARVAEHFGRGGPETAPRLVAKLGTTPAATRQVLLTGIEKGWPRTAKITLKEEDEKALVALLPMLNAEGQGRVVRLMTAWGSQAIAKHAAEVSKNLLATAEDEKAEEEARIAAARQVLELVGNQPEPRQRLLEIVGPRTAPKVAEAILEALGSVADEATTATILERYAGWTPALRAAAVRSLLARAVTTRALLTALDRGTVQVSDLALDQQQTLSNHPDRAIQAQAKKILARGGALPNPDRAKLIEERLALLKKTGDATRGKEVYSKHCAACHRHGNEGGNVGPDLTGFAVHPKEEILVHLLDPNRSVEGNFRVFTAQMRDGRVFNGLIASETRTSLEIVDANAKRFTLQRADVEELTGSNRSLMPEGFEKQINDEGLVDLLEFLTRKGKYLPLPLEKAASVVTTRGMFYDEASTLERLVFADWKPKTVGEVPFVLIDPQGDRVKNAVMLYSTNGKIPPTMPKSVKLPCNTPARAIHLLGGVGGWAHPASPRGSVSMIVRLHYADGSTEDHELKNGVHIADYIRKVDVPESKYAFAVRGQQVRYLSVTPKKMEAIKEVELVKGPDATAPVVLAITVETGN